MTFISFGVMANFGTIGVKKGKVVKCEFFFFSLYNFFWAKIFRLLWLAESKNNLKGHYNIDN